jgi:hypothetical protein
MTDLTRFGSEEDTQPATVCTAAMHSAITAATYPCVGCGSDCGSGGVAADVLAALAPAEVELSVDRGSSVELR